jgi:hypothetical protein
VKTKRLARSVSVLLGSAVLWAVPLAPAHACDGQPSQDGKSQQAQEGTPPKQVSSESAGGSRSCFRRYEPACQRTRREQNRYTQDND